MGTMHSIKKTNRLMNNACLCEHMDSFCVEIKQTDS
jgi:hypothetical protein